MRVTAIVAVLVSACAAGQTGAARTLPPRNLITAEELSTVTALDLHEAVAKLRPQWLRFRGITSVRDPSAGQVRVYQDGVRMGDLDTLRRIRVEDVRELRFLGGPDATLRWGTGHGGGVIEVITK